MSTAAPDAKALLAAFANDPDGWRAVVTQYLYVGLGDLVDFCAEYYGTEPNPITKEN